MVSGCDDVSVELGQGIPPRSGSPTTDPSGAPPSPPTKEIQHALEVRLLVLLDVSRCLEATDGRLIVRVYSTAEELDVSHLGRLEESLEDLPAVAVPSERRVNRVGDGGEQRL